MIFVGVDIGVTGAVAAIAESSYEQANLVLSIWDMPTVLVKQGSQARAYDPDTIESIARNIDGKRITRTDQVAMVFELCHHQRSRPALSMGIGMGIWMGISAAHDWSRFPVTAHAWKKHYKLTKAAKGASRLKAQGAWPEADLGTRSTEDRAEAVLLAMFCRHLVRGSV